jgi:hypothetical protein
MAKTTIQNVFVGNHNSQFNGSESKPRSPLEVLAWITGIIVSLIVIWQTFAPKPNKGVNVHDRTSTNTASKDSLLATSPFSGKATATRSHKPAGRKPTTVRKSTGGTVGSDSMGVPTEQKANNSTDVNKLPFSPVQRHITLEDIRELQREIAKRNTTTAVVISAGTNRECRIYAAEIRKSLDSLGYPVDPHIYDEQGNGPDKRFHVGGVWTTTFIRVYPIYQY